MICLFYNIEKFFDRGIHTRFNTFIWYILKYVLNSVLPIYYRIVPRKKGIPTSYIVNRQVIVSLTTFPERMKRLPLVLESIFRQTGGVYTIISNGILAMDGNCYGAAYTDDLKVIHKKADSQKNRNQFRESKYVQSDLMSCYEEIKCDLEKKKFVLFSGTPCQVAGLKSFLEKCGTTQERLYLLDVVCHGVPSPLVFNDYLSYIEKKYKSAVVKYTFRNKNKGWKGYHPEVILENGTTIQENEILNTYIELFKENIMLRECCYTCPYSSLKRPGDFTIGDFWGIDIIDHEYSDNKGISMLFINSDKGKKFWTQFCKNEHLTIKKYSCSVLTQHNLYKSTIPSFAKDKFWKEYHKKGYDGVVEKYTSLGDKYWLFYLKKATRIRLKKYLDN